MFQLEKFHQEKKLIQYNYTFSSLVSSSLVNWQLQSLMSSNAAFNLLTVSWSEGTFNCIEFI